MAQFILKLANSLLNFIIIVSLLLAGTYAGYALWDNNQVYAAASNVQADMIKLKPILTENEDEGASFEELLAINKDVCAWVTVANPNIDFPILKGETPRTYINRDVYANFALAGSIFLDSINDKDFHDIVSLLYGHHMDQSDMFGDLDKYKDETFLKENTTGLLILPDRSYDLEIFACILTDASNDAIFEPQEYKADINKLIRLTEQEGLHYNADKLEELKKTNGQKQILILSTCSTEFTDARTIVLAEMIPHSK